MEAIREKSHVDFPDTGTSENMTLKLIVLRPRRAGVGKSDDTAVSIYLGASETVWGNS